MIDPFSLIVGALIVACLWGLSKTDWLDAALGTRTMSYRDELWEDDDPADIIPFPHVRLVAGQTPEPGDLIVYGSQPTDPSSRVPA